MRADLHTHSTYSDGLYSPDELCRLAKNRGVELFSITDHDTMNGDDVKREAAKKYGVRYVSGWEVSAYSGEEKVHILGYGCRINDAYLEFMNKRKESALIRAAERVEKLRALGIPVTLDEALSMRADPTTPVHTMHVARATARYLGINEADVYCEYLARGKAAYSGSGRPTPEEAIDCIHASGGIAVIAHPGRIRMEKEEKESLIRSLAEYGADGIEAVYTTHTKSVTAWFCALAEKYSLLITGGSDTHVEEGRHAVGSPCFIADGKLTEKLSPYIV